MSRFRRVVLDTSTLVGAAIRTGSVPHQALVKALDSCFLCVSRETLAELEGVLYRRKFDRYLDRESRDIFLELVHRGAYRFPLDRPSTPILQPSCRDPKDDKFLALALAVEADVLVSSDKDLLVLHPWRGGRIVTPAEFVGESSTEASALPTQANRRLEWGTRLEMAESASVSGVGTRVNL